MENIDRKLDAVFSKQSRIDSQLKTGSSTLLSHKLEFLEASKPQSSINNMLKDKYTNLAPPGSSPSIVKKSPSATGVDEGEGLPQPTQVLFQASKLDYSWKYMEGGAGLMNCGNTCFLNAVMQCLIHTPPLTNYLLSGDHFAQCKLYSREKCILCNLQMLMKRSLTGAADSFSPKWFINNLQYIGRHFRNGRQEDAHEFLRLSLEKMQKCALVGLNNLDRYSKETTVINQIFGGFLRSQVVCLKCRARSNTYDPVLDISLDIKNVDSIEKALEHFVAPDKLDMDNAYKCDKCKQKVPALKRFSIHKSPNVLTIQLKRFQFAQTSFFGGGKISKHVKYPSRLNIRPYMSNKNGPPEMYSLFATIQHEGYSCQSGHYVANARCGQRWYHFNDSMKRRTSAQQCLNESSVYVLFYLKESDIVQSPSANMPFKSQVDAKVKQNVKQNGNHQFTNGNKFIGPAKPQIIKTPEKHPHKAFNGINGIQTSDIKKSTPSPVAPLAQRDKVRIAFGIKSNTPNQQKSPSSLPSTKPTSKLEVPMGTPRLVMKIKDGKSITIETSPDGERRILSDDDEVIAKMNEKRHKKFSKRSSLVPYGDDSSSDSDWGNKNGLKATSLHGCTLKQSNGVVFDQRLNATTSVPGNNHLYETIAVKDKLNHVTPHNNTTDTGRSVKSGANTPVKRLFTETLTCVTTPPPSKHAGGGEWHASEGMLSPSIASHSSIHSNNSTSDWAVSNNGKLHPGYPDRVQEGWTVTPSKLDQDKKHTVTDGAASRTDYRSSTADLAAEKKEHVGHAKSQTNLKRQVMQEQLSRDESVLNSPTTNDRACLLDTDIVKDKSSEEYKLYKKLKKHKKHKHKHADRDKERYEELRDDGDEEYRHKKKKKKKKKHKHKERDNEREESPPGDHDYHKQENHSATKRKSDRNTEETNHKRTRVDSGSSSEFEWVEKKVDTPKGYTKSVPATPSVGVDHLVKDGHRQSYSGSNTPQKYGSWDGVKASKVAAELERISKFGYGSQVSSWDGQRSHLDMEKERHNGTSRKRNSDDEYDEEFDMGKVKKVKHKHFNDHRFNGNVFQEEQNMRNKDKTSWSDIKVGNNNPFFKQSSQTTSFNTHLRM